MEIVVKVLTVEGQIRDKNGCYRVFYNSLVNEQQRNNPSTYLLKWATISHWAVLDYYGDNGIFSNSKPERNTRGLYVIGE